MGNTAQNDLKGAFYIVGGAVCFGVCGGLIKHLTADMSAGMAGFLRHVFALPFFLPMIWRRGWGSVATTRPLGHFLRGAAGFGSFMMFVVALTHMRMGDAFALSYTTPFWSFLIAVLVFGERLGAARVAATAIGFAGVLMLVKPAGDFNAYALVALASASLTSVAMMMVKQLSATEPPDRIAFWFILAGIPLGAPLAAFAWTPPGVDDVVPLVLLGALTWLGQRCLSRGYALGQFSKMAPLVYVQVAVATAIGIFAFGEVPDLMAVAGMVLIAAGAIAVVRPAA
ncbi:MAG: DMT family transporter [Rhodospirillales bacterium]|nr:DMT family transporter [Rhodospirillales bacterium]